MPHRSYKNPPIVEAVVALAFSPPVPFSAEAVEGLKRALRTEYDGRERVQSPHTVQATFQPGSVRASASSQAKRFLLPTSDGTALVGFGADVLSVHVLQPYPGWRSFRARTERALGQLVAAQHPGSVVEVAVRYIDRISVPAANTGGGQGAAIHEYFLTVPPRPAAMPNELVAFQSVIEAQDAHGVLAALTVASVPPSQGEAMVMLYDLNVVRKFDSGALQLADVWDVVEALHDRQYQIFEQSVTDKARGLFE